MLSLDIGFVSGSLPLVGVKLLYKARVHKQHHYERGAVYFYGITERYPKTSSLQKENE
jgi:hypothetical protein